MEGGGAMPPFHPPTGAELNTFIIKKFRNKDVTPRRSCYLLLVLAVQRSIKLGTRSTEIDQTWYSQYRDQSNLVLAVQRSIKLGTRSTEIDQTWYSQYRDQSNLDSVLYV